MARAPRSKVLSAYKSASDTSEPRKPAKSPEGDLREPCDFAEAPLHSVQPLHHGESEVLRRDLGGSSSPRPGGQPPRQFTPEERAEAETLAGVGVTHKQIAILLGCSEPTLRRHLAAELAAGDARATARVARSLFSKAIGGDTACMIFWMKVRAGWKEGHDVTLTVRGASEMSDVELERIVERARDMLALEGSSEAP